VTAGAPTARWHIEQWHWQTVSGRPPTR